MNLKKIPDGLFGVNDEVCFSAMKQFREYGLNIPEDIAVVGFDNTPMADYFSPPLTSIDRKSFEIGSTAAYKLLKIIEKKDFASTLSKIVLEPELIIRKTSKNLAIK